MSKKAEVKINNDGIRALLKSDEVMDVLLKVAPSEGEIEANYRNISRCVVKVKK